MSHLDEGTLHALLDGELELNEVAEIQAHLGSCSACGLRLREVKEFLGEADRLIASVELDAPATRPAPAEVHARPEPPPRPAERPRPPEPRPAPREVPPAAWEPWNEHVPVILVPDNESPAERRRRLFQRYGWAAMILILVGAGVLGRLSRPVPTFGPMAAPDSLARTDAEVVSQAETVRPEQPPAQIPETNRGALALQKSTPAAKPPAKAPAPTLQARDEKQATGRAEAVPAESPRRADLAADTAAPASTDSIAVASETDSAGAGTEDLATVRQRASEALAQLDREKRRNQAAAATAALDAAKRRRAAQPAAAVAAAPTPPTPDERAQVYLRIGLDEASRQLGGPAHVIEGMSPLFMGLAQGVVVPGADATRPVVRVVYQDAQGRLIFLDQQRLRAGQAAPSGSALSWIQGDTAIWLHGEPGPEILRTYRPRVR
jgi:hypothetical protein